LLKNKLAELRKSKNFTPLGASQLLIAWPHPQIALAPPIPPFTMFRQYGAIRPDQTKNQATDNREEANLQKKLSPLKST
jgi:hypothetical protein